jgi:hypothetical protein
MYRCSPHLTAGDDVFTYMVTGELMFLPLSCMFRTCSLHEHCLHKQQHESRISVEPRPKKCSKTFSLNACDEFQQPASCTTFA